MSKVTVFALSGCPHCKKAKALLAEKSIPYTEINVELVPSRRNLMIEATGRKTVPQIFFADEHIGGNDDLQKLNETGQLDNLWQRTAAGPGPTLPLLTPLSESEMVPARPYDVPSDDRAFSINGIKYPYDKLVEMLRDPNNGVNIGTHKYHFQSYPNCFIGKEFVDWTLKNLNVPTREDAIKLGARLMEGRMFHHVCRSEPFRDGNFFYRLQEDESTDALNMKKIWTGDVRKPTKVAAELRKMLTALYDKFLDEDGVDYAGMSKSREFADFQTATAELQRIDLGALHRDEMIAFGVNVYNMLVIHAFATVGPPNGMWGRLNFFSKTAYNLGGHNFSLSEIENGILRGNKVPPGSFRRPFGSSDPRRQFVVVKPDPRIHFALNCGAKSCPPIKVMDPDELDDQLALSTEAYLENTVINNGEIQVSKLFKWYSEDFGSSTLEKLEFIKSHLPPEKQTALASMSATPTLSYLPYDWTVNAKTRAK